MLYIYVGYLLFWETMPIFVVDFFETKSIHTVAYAGLEITV